MSDGTPSPDKSILSKSNAVPAGGAGAILLALFYFGGDLKTRMDEDSRMNIMRFEQIGKDIREVKEQLGDEVREVKWRLDRAEQNAVDRWTATHQRLWASEMRRSNPELIVPNVDDVKR